MRKEECREKEGELGSQGNKEQNNGSQRRNHE